ncbi:MAG: molybdopterin-dependent oxidoreductase, partial [Terracidiphilus sp.]
MSLVNWLARKSGLDILSAKYSYGEDPVLGFTSARKHADHWVNSTCGYCSVGCGMQLGVRDGKVVSVRGNPDHPVNSGKLCPKGLAEHYAIDAEDRAKYPLLRKDREFTRIGWDEAVDTLVERFRQVQQKYGPESLGIVSTGQLVTEEFYALGKLVQLGFGTNNYDGNTTLCMSTAVAGYKRSFGSDGPPGAYEDLETADVILLIGANIAENHPILCTRLEANTAKTLIVADPRVTKTAMMADVYLPVKPRSDLALINAILRILID